MFYNIFMLQASLLPEEQVDGCAMQIPVLANLVFQIAFVGILDPLRQVAEEDERGNLCSLEHGDILDFHILALDGRGRKRLDGGLQDVVQLRGRDDNLAVVIHLDCGLQHLVDALLGNGRPEDDGEVGERCEAFADGRLEVIDGLL